MTKRPPAVIIITGPKHSGKTSAGKALARLWEGLFPGGAAEFTDLDELVEKRTGKSPRTLYREGPQLFRRAEAEALQALLEGAGGDTIAAAGGGLADNGEALKILKKCPAALVVYIDVPAETAWERIRAAADKTGELPPFLNTENPRETHRQLHSRRGAVYRKLAKITVQAGNSPEETAAAILCVLADTSGPPGAP
ncbi:MAG: shikimate kinase [Treponema sp.]|jgi:shikimate kinase|nr:shikimate kinase [Treponema sp.]